MSDKAPANNLLLPTFEPTPIELVRSMTLSQRVDRAIALLKEHEPPEGYYLAFSGGKDSCAIKKLAQLAGVKFEAWYNQTTIDPPELVRFIKEHHGDVKWNIPEQNMMSAVQQNGMPTRFMRWCCRLYKEQGGIGRTCVFGVRAAESHRRELLWREVGVAGDNRPAICPIVYWTDEQLWDFIRQNGVEYCELYDEGLERLGCLLCPLKNGTERESDARRYPLFARNWQRACRKYWETHKDQVLKSGKHNFCGQFKTWQEYWRWWMSDRTPDIMRDECQTGLLWANHDREPLCELCGKTDPYCSCYP